MSNINYNFKISNEDKLLILCIQIPLNYEIRAKINQILQNDLDWDYIIQNAINHKILQIVYWNLKNFSEFVPEDRLNSLKDYFTRNAQNNLLFLGELLKILELFESEEINVMPYKGPVLAIHTYGELTLRQFGDLDIFIFKEDIFKVQKILISQGYKPEFNVNGKWGNRYVSSQRELKFFNKSKNVTIEIHWKFSGIFFSFPKYTKNILINDVKKINLNNKSIIAPSDEDLLLILCLHNASHRWNHLEWIVDIYVLINSSNINWSNVIDKAGKLRIKRILYINLKIIKDILEINLPDTLINNLDSNLHLTEFINDLELYLLKNNNQRSLLDELFISFKIRENILYGFKDCLKGLFSPSFYEFNNFLLPYYLFYLYYVYRPIHLIKRFKLFNKHVKL